MPLDLPPQELRTFFVRFVTAERRSLFQVEGNADLLLDVLRFEQGEEALLPSCVGDYA
jgi:hypothetical protein